MVRKKYVMLTMFLLFWGVSSTAQTFKFKQIKTDNVCLVQLMENITKIISNSSWQRDSQHHHLSITVDGTDTLLEIHSYDFYGFYETISKNDFFGVCIILGHEFYIDSSFVNLFCYTGKSFKKRYNPKIVEDNRLNINDSYYYWLFKKTFCGIDLCGFWIMDDYKDWYNLELDPNCFCDYKNMTIDFVSEPEDIDDN